MKKGLGVFTYNISEFISLHPLHAASTALLSLVLPAVLFLQIVSPEELKPSYIFFDTVSKSPSLSGLQDFGINTPTSTKQVPVPNRNTFLNNNKTSASSSSSTKQVAVVNPSSSATISSSSLKSVSTSSISSISSVKSTPSSSSSKSSQSSSQSKTSQRPRFLVVNPDAPRTLSNFGNSNNNNSGNSNTGGGIL